MRYVLPFGFRMDNHCPCGCKEQAWQYGDSECLYALEAEYQEREAEFCIEFQDTLESLGANRYGHADFRYLNQVYINRQRGIPDDVIPF